MQTRRYEVVDLLDVDALGVEAAEPGLVEGVADRVDAQPHRVRLAVGVEGEADHGEVGGVPGDPRGEVGMVALQEPHQGAPLVGHLELEARNADVETVFAHWAQKVAKDCRAGWTNV